MNENIYFLLNGGKGTRFSKEYSLYKPSILIYGIPMYKYVVESLNLDSLNIVTHQNHESENIYCDLLKDYDNINHITLDYYTRGPIETCKLAINKYKYSYINKKIWFLDNDIIYSKNINWNINLLENEICVLIQKIDDIELHSLEENYSPYSHVLIHDEYIIDIIEKKPISQYVVIGAYGFGSISIFNKLFNIFNCNSGINNMEWYMSLLIKTALDNNIKVKYILSEFNINIGTPEDLNNAIENKKIIPKKLRWVFDLDNTIISYPYIKNNYSTVKPITEIINFINDLYSQGHYIIIHTARNMKSNSVTNKTKESILESLQKYNVKYHELILNKPYGDIYIDDKAVNSMILRHSNWRTNEIGYGYDKLLYNNDTITEKIIKIDTNLCYKLASYNEMIGLKYFYENCDKKLLKFMPKIYEYIKLENSKYKITMEWINSISISKLYYNSIINDNIFNKLINLMKLIHGSENNNDINVNNIFLNYYPKLISRINKFNIYKKLNINLSVIKEFFDNYDPYITKCIHGDFWFNNLLWSENNNNIYMIDMKGMLGNNTCIYGDKFYDYSKLYQSICGFDSVLYTGNYINDFIYNKYKNKFIELLNLTDTDMIKIKRITSFLILGSLPFHKINDYQLDIIKNIIYINWPEILHLE